MLCNCNIHILTRRKLIIKDITFFCLGIKSTDHGALIGGMLGGICFLAIIVFVCILVAKKRRQSYAGIALSFLLRFLLPKSIQYNSHLPFIASVQILCYALMLALPEN